VGHAATEWDARAGRTSCLLILVIACVWLAAMAGSARAADYTVGTTADLPGVCAAGPCSLRQLIAAVHAAPFPPDTISVPAGTYTLSPELGALLITDNLSIVGAGARTTVIAMPVPADRSLSGDRVFAIRVPAGGTAPTVAIAGVTLSGGTANPANGYYGGNVINDSAALTLSDDWITNGSAYSGGGAANTQGTLTVLRSLISGNRAPFGGGDSGGILNHGAPATTTTPDRPGHLVVESSTITGNDAREVGGIFTFGDPTNTLVVRNSTIAGNTSMDEPGGALRPSGGGLGSDAGSARVQNSIVAGNVAISGGVSKPTNCGLSASGPITSLGSNVDSGTDCLFGKAADVSSTDPLLGPLQDNGGPTDTFALRANSPALDRVESNCPALDQRGVTRPQGPACDAGAFERAVAAPGAPATQTGSTTPRKGALPSLGATTSGTYLFFSKGRTRVERLLVGPLPAGATVVLTCTSPKKAPRSARCPFKKRTIKVNKAVPNLQLAKYFKTRRLALRTTFAIRATKPGTIGLYARFVTRNKKIPTKLIRCLPPGTSTPAKC
jgi:hypothetical protein